MAARWSAGLVPRPSEVHHDGRRHEPARADPRADPPDGWRVILRRACASLALLAAPVALTATSLTAQVGSMRVTLPSPNAASLGKFGDVPVNLYSGVPDISVPLFTAKGRTLELPVTARYHPGGIRVEEVGGWLGIGWSLEAGGVITRTVRGLVDENANGYFNTGHTFYAAGNWPSPPASLISNIEDETLDGEPDQFFFNFAGRSGQFVIGPTSTSTTLKEIRTIPYQKLRIVPTFSSGIAAWTILTEDGTRYTFAAKETNTDATSMTPGGVFPSHANETYTSAWHLTEIRSPGGDVITLGYTPYTASYKVGGYQEKFDQIVTTPPNACVSPQFEVRNGHDVVTQRLTTITSAAHTVTFVPGPALRTDALSPAGIQQEPRLDTIRVATPTGVVLRRFGFEHDYSTGRLTLRNIFERDSAGTSLPPHTFTYGGPTLPAYASYAQDHWGYYNGRTGNTSPIPAAITPSGSALTGADRSPDSAYAKAGTLTRITYPTGGYSEFVYEQNDYGGVGLSGTSPVGAGPPQSVSADSPSGATGPVSTPFTVGGSKTVIATVTVFLQPSGCVGVGCPYATIPLHGTWAASGTFQLALAPGSYTVTADDFSGGPGHSAFISVTWRDSITVKRKPGGGLRVAEVRTADAMGAVTTRKYKYQNPSDTLRSSGVVSAEPAYAFQYNGATCQYFSRSSMTRMPLGGGPPVGYREVVVWHGANGEFGKTMHTFRTVRDVDDDQTTSKWPFYKRTSREWKRGQEKVKAEYSPAGVLAGLAQRTGASYAFMDEGATPDTATTRRYRGMSLRAFSSGAFGGTSIVNPFEIISAWTFKNGDSTVVYDTLQAKPITWLRAYAHANPKHLQPTQITETNSDGTQRITNLRYPADYAAGAGNAEAVALTAMQDTFNIQNAVVERWVVKRAAGVDSVVQGEVTSYKLAAAGTAQYLPYQRFFFNNPTPLPAASYVPSAVSGAFTKDGRYLLEETANLYDASGRATQLTDARGRVRSYLYGGNVNNAFLVKVTKVKDAGLPTDLVTDLAYDTDGNVASIRDEGGTFRYFTYDRFGRLTQVKNHASTVVTSYGYTYSRTGPAWTFNPAAPNAVVETTFLQPAVSVVGTQYLDGLERVIQRVDKDGGSYHVTATQYDAMGRPWRAWKPYTRASAGYDAAFAANATGFYNTYLGQTQAKPYVETLYRAEPLSRVSRVIPEYVGAAPSLVRLHNYDTEPGTKRRISEVTDEAGKRTQSFADVFGNQVKRVLGVGAAEQTTTALASNVLGQRTKATDPRGLVTTFALDTRGLQTARTSPDAGTVSYKYDTGRNPRFSQDARQAAAGTVAFTSYDFAGRPLVAGVGTATFATLDPNAALGTLDTANANWLVVRQYDVKPSTLNPPWSRFATQINPLVLTNVSGRLAAVASKSNGAWQVTLFSYDADGRVATRSTFTEANGGATVLTAVNTTVTYARDFRDALTERHLTVGAATYNQWYDYDARGLLWKVFGSAAAGKPGTPDVTYTYRPSGQVASRLFAGGPTVPFAYTIREQLAAIGDPATTTYPFSARYTYNGNGTVGTAEFYSAGSPAANKRYKYDFPAPAYDAINRLKSADYSFWNGAAWTATLAHDLAGITYDVNGNLTALQRYRETATLVDNLTYTIAPTSNRLTSVADAAGATAEAWDAEAGGFTYDGNGNQLTAPGPFSITAATYDQRNLPLSLTVGGIATGYRYEDGGQRIAKQVGAGNTEVYVREGTTTLGAFTVNAGGAVVSSFFNLLADDRVVGRLPSGGRSATTTRTCWGARGRWCRGRRSSRATTTTRGGF